jgi:hypothetical protein
LRAGTPGTGALYRTEDTAWRSHNQSIVLVLVVVLMLGAAGKLVPNKGFAFSERIQSGKEMLVRIVAMLTKLVERFDP